MLVNSGIPEFSCNCRLFPLMRGRFVWTLVLHRSADRILKYAKYFFCLGKTTFQLAQFCLWAQFITDNISWILTVELSPYLLNLLKNVPDFLAEINCYCSLKVQWSSGSWSESVLYVTGNRCVKGWFSQNCLSAD